MWAVQYQPLQGLWEASLYAVGWTILTDAYGFLGECDCLSVQQARRHKKASITLPNYHKYAAHTM